MATLAANNIESHLAQLECPRVEEFFDDHSYQNDSHLIAVELALQAVKRTTDNVYALANSLNQDPRYAGKFAQRAFADLHKIDKITFEELLATKKSIAVEEPPSEIFATLEARQLTLEKAARRAEAAVKYANDIFGAIQDLSTVLEYAPDRDNQAKLKRPSSELASARSIANAAAEGIRERLGELTNASHTATQLQQSSQDDTKLIISVELAIKAAKEAAKEVHDVSIPILDNNEYRDPEWDEIRADAKTDFEKAHRTFNRALSDNK